jgi:hypothetical protein
VERRPQHHRQDHRRGLRRSPGPAERNRTDQFHGRQPLNEWINGIHAIVPDLSFVLDVGPIADEQHLTAPATLASFTDAEGAGAHCQAGAQRLLCARTLDWLDETLAGPQTRPHPASHNHPATGVSERSDHLETGIKPWPANAAGS